MSATSGKSPRPCVNGICKGTLLAGNGMPLHISGGGAGVGVGGAGVGVTISVGVGVIVAVFTGTDIDGVEVGVITPLVSASGVVVDLSAYADIGNR